MLVNLAVLMRQPTGISTYALNLLPAIAALDPTLLVSEPIAGYRCYEIPAGQTPEQGIRGHIKRLAWTQLALPKLYRQLAANLIFSPLPEAPLGSACRSIVTLHDLIPLRFNDRFSPLTVYHRYYIPQVLRSAQHILCNSTATARDAIDLLGIPAAKLTPIPLAYNAEFFRFLDLPTRNYFLYVGRHHPYKNVQRLIVAFATLPEHCRWSQLWIAGPIDRRYTPQLMEQSRELGVADRVKFIGYIEDSQLAELLNQAIALVFPSLWEGFGIPILEAMACGTPVITSNLSALPEVAGDAALFVDPYHTQDITAAMTAVLMDATARSQLRRASLARAGEFSWHKTGQATVEVLQQYGESS
jgi:glycosyltransferase involved in cell wall biosynthesis